METQTLTKNFPRHKNQYQVRVNSKEGTRLNCVYRVYIGYTRVFERISLLITFFKNLYQAHRGT